MQIKNMSMTDMVTLILEKKKLEEDKKTLYPRVRAEVQREYKGVDMELAERCITLRGSHFELARDYNRRGRTMDETMTNVICAYLGIDKDLRCLFFNSCPIQFTDIAHENGLHYRRSIHHSSGGRDGSLAPDLKASARENFRKIAHAIGRGKRPGENFGYVPLMDLFNDRTHGFNLRHIGYTEVDYPPEFNPHDLWDRKISREPTQVLQDNIEDYVIADRFPEWLATKELRGERARQLQHSFYRQ